MPDWWQINWSQVLVPTVSPLEIVLRGTAVYLGIFVLLRIVVKREVGSLALPDLLLIVLVADAAQNAMAAEYRSVPEGLILVATLIGWSLALDWLAYHVPFFERLVRQAPLPLIVDGRMLRKQMARELITEDDLLSRLRQEGIADVSEVSRAYLEGDGQISVLKRKSDPEAHQSANAHRRRAR